MMRLSPSAMRMFVAVVEERSFTRAAARENATQSGVSQQVKKLEEGLGILLLHREHGQVTPTPAGEHLYKRCVTIIRLIAAAESETRVFARGLDGEIRVGLMPALTRCITGRILRQLRREHPNAVVRILEAPSGPLLNHVAAQDIDLAIVPTLDPPDAIEITPIGVVPEMFVTAGPSPLHGRAADLRTVDRLHLITPSHGNIRAQRIMGYLASIGVEPAEVIELDPMPAVLEYVANSDFAAILPAVMMLPEIESGSLCVRPIVSPPFQLPLGVASPRRASLNPLARVFLDRFAAEIDPMAGADNGPDLVRPVAVTQ
jgi:LysR family transcriptional regulator, nitrogen assimilation regulatory protein